MKRFLAVITLLLFSFFLYCGHGLEPPPIKTAVSGMVRFQNWPSADSLFDLRVVVFKQFPPQDIIGEIFAQTAFVYPPITEPSMPFFVDSTAYFLELPAGTYAYVVVAQQYGPNLYLDWRAVGQYDVDVDSLPSPITVHEGEVLENIDIQVDFKNLPIQPF